MAWTLKNGESLEAIYNEGKDELYRWKKVGDILTAVGAITAGGTVSNAYEVAKIPSGKHYHWYKQQLNLGHRQLQQGIRSFEKQIEDHESWLCNPQSKVSDWEKRSGAYQEGLLKKWRQDIARHQEQIAILQGVLKEKDYGE
ncbi:MAG: hypothetical protein HC889_11295 [Synechococcaceae cyanobacterium SM1_2_3]|nr:hypothetical protein [Synechococcaceae cyanobacterium SM1_2_3]